MIDFLSLKFVGTVDEKKYSFQGKSHFGIKSIVSALVEAGITQESAIKLITKKHTGN